MTPVEMAAGMAGLLTEIELLKRERAVWREMAEASYAALWALEAGHIPDDKRMAMRNRIKMAWALLEDMYEKPPSGDNTK